MGGNARIPLHGRYFDLSKQEHRYGHKRNDGSILIRVPVCHVSKGA